MTTMTLALSNNGGHPADRARGRADAYDEHRTGADLDTLEDRYEWMVDPLTAHNVTQLVSAGYIDGYLAYIQEARTERATNRITAHREYAQWAAKTDRKAGAR